MGRKLIAFALSFALVLGIAAGLFWYYFGPTGSKERYVAIVPQQSAEFDVTAELDKLHVLKQPKAFAWLYGVLVAGGTVAPGGYRVDGTMTAWDLINTLTAPPDFVWVTVREGLRKEQIGILLKDKLGWRGEQEAEWNRVYADSVEYREGVYFPDTYLLPRDETPAQIAARFVAHFNEKFAPYTDVFAKKNIRWVTALKIASLIQREAGGASDMPIISAVLWNRLDKGMPLQIDATIQYALGNAESGWWPVIKGSDIRVTDSPYNTYLSKGLPPTPIANPGLAAIDAVANPAETDCLYYLHDRNRQIHCSRTYEEHLENIRTYLN